MSTTVGTTGAVAGGAADAVVTPPAADPFADTRTTAPPGNTADGGEKTYFAGTHRACPPARTWERLAPLLPAVGVARVADLTWLDDIGIPVYQAVAPAGRYLSVYQGKGLDPVSAKVSAAMEAIERWHGEHLDMRPDHVGTVGDVEPALGYRVGELALRARHCLNPATRLDWRSAVRLSDGGPSLVPLDCLSLDRRVRPRWRLPLFAAISNGLAGGNTRSEAIAHGLYEVIERDAVHRAWRTGPSRMVDADSLAGPASDLVARYRAAGVEFGIGLLATPLGVPCFGVAVLGGGFPLPIYGYGCHLDAQVALCRALTEAAQIRVSVIAGARDDLEDATYRRLRHALSGAAPAPPPGRSGPASVPFDAVPSEVLTDHRDEIARLVDRVVAVTGRSPLYVDHTRDDLGVPVVHVLCPGMTMPRSM